MTAALEALYSGVILDHNKHPRNYRRLVPARHAVGYNPLCGDRVTVYLRVEAGVIRDAAFEGFACAIATASASLMTESVTGKTVADAEALLARVERLMMAGPGGEALDGLGELSALVGVRQYPARVKCAMLAWQTFRAAAGEREE
jgi:nitrogen fixation protein NifU and related proteins